MFDHEGVFLQDKVKSKHHKMKSNSRFRHRVKPEDTPDKEAKINPDEDTNELGLSPLKFNDSMS